MLNIKKELKDIFENAGVQYIEEDYPQGFSLTDFATISSYKGKIEYCNQHLKKLGAGSSRIAYQVDNEKVLKIAKNQKGLAQNEAEMTFGAQSYPEIFAQIYEADYVNSLWLEMELARKPLTQDFKNIFGISSKDFFGVLAEIVIDTTSSKNLFIKSYQNENSMQLYEKFINEEHPFFYTFQTYMYNYSPKNTLDLFRIANWGVVTRSGKEHIVIIDNGLNDEIAKQYYGAK